MKRLRLLAATIATTSAAIAILLAWEISAKAQKPEPSKASTDIFQSQSAAKKLKPLANGTPPTPVPEKVVTEFLSCVRAAKKDAALAQLSPKAREHGGDLAYNLLPPDSPQAEFDVLPMSYITPERTAAHVQVRWSNAPDDDGKRFVYDIILVLRKDADDWRIVGAIQKLLPKSPPISLDFEDPNTRTRVSKEYERQVAEHLATADAAIPVIASKSLTSSLETPSSNEIAPSITGGSLKTIRLKHAIAADLAVQIQRLYGESVVIFDERTNTISMRGTDAALGEIEKFIERLDVPGPDSPRENNPFAAESNPNERNILAQIDGTVTEVLVNYGDEVKAGQELLKLKNPELEMRCKQHAADLDPAIANLKHIEELQKKGIVADIEVLAPKATVENLQLQQKLDLEKLQLLTIKSPIDGKIATENLRERLIERPVTKGEILLRLALASNDVPARHVDSLMGSTRREVRSNTEGIVKEVLVKYGDRVKTGQPIVQIQDPKLDEDMWRMQKDIKRLKDMIQFDEKRLANNEYDNDDSKREASARLENYKKAVEKYAAQYKQYEGNNKCTVIASPIDGIVATRDVREQLIKQPVKYGDPLLILAVPSKDSPTPATPPMAGPTYYNPGPNPYVYPNYEGNYGYSTSPVVERLKDKKYVEAENEAGIAAADYRRLSAFASATAIDQPDLKNLKAKLQQAVATAFNERQKSHTAELDALRKRLNQIEATISTREKNRQAIINRRVEELINPDVKWDAGTAVQPQRNQPPTRNQQVIQPTLTSGTKRLRPVFEERVITGPDGKKTTVMESRMAEEEVVVNSPQPQNAPINLQPETSTTRPYQALPPLETPKITYVVPDTEAILGDWKIESSVELTPAVDRPDKCAITKEFIIFSKDGEPTSTSTYKIDSTKNPKWFDLREKNQRLSNGIYKLQGNQLTLCFPKPDPAGGDALDRPTAFPENPDSANLIVVKLKRKEPILPPAAQPTQTQDPSQIQLEKPTINPILGQWNVETVFIDGEFDKAPLKKFVFTDDILAMYGEGEKPVKSFYKLDPTKSPPTIDFSGWNNEPLQGIYEIEGDELRIAYSPSEATSRPTSFDPKQNPPDTSLIIFKRNASAR